MSNNNESSKKSTNEQTTDSNTTRQPVKELSVILKLKTTTKFNRTRILQRLPYFSYFFKEINGLIKSSYLSFEIINVTSSVVFTPNFDRMSP